MQGQGILSARIEVTSNEIFGMLEVLEMSDQRQEQTLVNFGKQSAVVIWGHLNNLY